MGPSRGFGWKEGEPFSYENTPSRNEWRFHDNYTPNTNVWEAFRFLLAFRVFCIITIIKDKSHFLSQGSRTHDQRSIVWESRIIPTFPISKDGHMGWWWIAAWIQISRLFFLLSYLKFNTNRTGDKSPRCTIRTRESDVLYAKLQGKLSACVCV